MRAPFNVAVIAYRQVSDGPEFLILRRTVENYWQVIAGGGEGSESETEAAMRESHEEAATPPSSKFMRLETFLTVSVRHFNERTVWRSDLYAVPQYYFAVDMGESDVQLSEEHCEYRWVPYSKAIELVKWDSDRDALWETNERLTRPSLAGP